jgi:hypothetical protein
VTVVAPNEKHVAYVGRDAQGDKFPAGMDGKAIASFGHFDAPDVRADAALIAASPTLVETLEWVRANYAAGSTAEINARIDAALRKARGEA